MVCDFTFTRLIETNPMLLKVITVMALASFEIYAAIPAGFAFHLSPLTIFLSSVTGSLLGLLITALLGDRVRQFFSKKKDSKESKPQKGLIYKIWHKYGVIGLGVLGTLTVGAPASVAVGIGLNGSVRRLMIWCSIGIISRCLLFTAIAHFGNNLL
jgi:membrane protein YqaA with SNARE-associated domain